MRRLWWGLLSLGLWACSRPNSPRYLHNDLQLATAYAAKETCSCVFVMEMDEAFCRRWTKAQPAVAKVAVDRETKTVTSFALILWAQRARYVNEKAGCVLE